MITRVGSIKYSDTFTSTGNGDIIDVSLHPLSKFTVSVRSTGVVTSWVVILEGSIDGINFSQIARHTDALGTGSSIYSGSNITPVFYFRTRCSSLLLGLGTNLIVTTLGTQ